MITDLKISTYWIKEFEQMPSQELIFLVRMIDLVRTQQLTEHPDCYLGHFVNIKATKLQSIFGRKYKPMLRKLSKYISVLTTEDGVESYSDGRGGLTPAFSKSYCLSNELFFGASIMTYTISITPRKKSTITCGSPTHDKEKRKTTMNKEIKEKMKIDRIKSQLLTEKDKITKMGRQRAKRLGKISKAEANAIEYILENYPKSKSARGVVLTSRKIFGVPLSACRVQRYLDSKKG